MKLYYNPQSRAVIAKWMLDECGAEYELVPIDLEQREHKTPKFLAINPAGKLPALVDGDAKLFENAAICLYLADEFPAVRLAPPIGTPERARYLSLMVYSTSQLEPAMGDELMKLDTPRRSAAGPTSTPCATWSSASSAAGPFLFGDWFTAADVMIGSMFIWKRTLGRAARPARARGLRGPAARAAGRAAARGGGERLITASLAWRAARTASRAARVAAPRRGSVARSGGARSGLVSARRRIRGAQRRSTALRLSIATGFET